MTPARFAVLPVIALSLAGLAGADETSDKQRKAAVANLAKAEVVGAKATETDALIVLTPLPEDRAKAVAGLLQKTYTTAHKGLRFDPKETPWPGKLAVYHLPGRADFTGFMRGVAGAKPEAGWHVSVRGDAPYVAANADLPAKASDADIAAELGQPVGAALFVARAGPSAKVPDWVRAGYGKAAALRAEGANGKRFMAYKTAARAATAGGSPARLADAWSGDRPDADVVAASVMDCLAFGPPAANFTKFLDGLKPDENGNVPDIETALGAVAGGKAEAFEAGWRRWVRAGMPVR